MVRKSNARLYTDKLLSKRMFAFEILLRFSELAHTHIFMWACVRTLDINLRFILNLAICKLNVVVGQASCYTP